MLFGNIWLSSILIVTVIFSATAMYKSYSDIQEAKQIQENYEIIYEIKTLLAKEYNKSPQNITRDEIIAHLPNGPNWEKVLLLDRNKDSNLANKELVNKSGNFEISEDEKLKLLALKAKLKNVIDVSSLTVDPITKKYTFEVGKLEKNRISKDKDIESSIDRAIYFLGVEILYSGATVTSSFLDTTINRIVDEFIPYDDMYQDFMKAGETEITTIVLNDRKKLYFKSKIKEQLSLNETAIETRLYLQLKDKL